MEERIGNPDLFTGRKEELAYFLKWINDIKERKSQSTAKEEKFVCPLFILYLQTEYFLFAWHLALFPYIGLKKKQNGIIIDI